MASKNNPRNWNDVQTAIATAAIVTTLGMWNLFATPAPKKVTQTVTSLPPTEESPVTSTPTPMPQVKIFFTTQTVPQSVAPQQEQTVTHKKKNKNNNSGGGGTVTTTRTS
jgi:hypothetical protein